MGIDRRSFWVGLGLGLLLPFLAVEVRYVNWRPVVPPIEAKTLQLRQDAKGDGRFGAPRSGHRQHRGIDLLAPLNTPVRSIRSGTVLQVGTHRGMGRFVEIAHGRSLTSLYAHLTTSTVEKGDRVTQGQQIGTVGKTGNARSPLISPHLHFEVARHGEVFDPATLGLRAIASAPTSAQATDGLGGD